MSSTTQTAIDATREGVQEVVEQIPPEAWPLLDLMFKIVIGLFIVWICLSLIAWWRRRAYNLTVASTARVNKKKQPGFLSVDKKDRERQIGRGEAHEDALDERDREDAAAALKAAKEPLTIGARIAKLATFLMSIVSLLTGFSGAMLGVQRLGGDISELSAAGRIKELVIEYPLGVAVCVFVIGFQIWQYFKKEKWKEK